MKAQIDLRRIFLTPPTSMLERLILFVTLVALFAVFFRPLQFSPMTPLEAVLTAALPAVSVSWAWLVLLRHLFFKRLFMKR